MPWKLQYWISKVRHLFRFWFWRRQLGKMSEILLWSTLSRFGRTTPMRLTVIIPLLGVILLFNKTIAESLVLSPFFIRDLGLEAGSEFSFSTLYFTYFGLCSLGIGSIVFSYACPKDIQSQPNQLEFVASTPIGDSKNLAKSYLRYIVQSFAIAAERINQKGNQPEETYSYPSSLLSEMNNLIGEIFNAADFNDESDEHVDSDPTESPDAAGNNASYLQNDDPDFMRVMNGAGYFDYTNFGIAMANEIAAYKCYTIPFYNQATNFPRDIAFLKFQTDDFSRFPARLLTAILYGIGLLLLSIPTIQTFVLLSKNVVMKVFI
ncbi:hypothetical protein [uncultured Cohaesibacter sp.]|uniref:hypothetical protein n=1 Tax=uncultured Cohaesibacter sp. TaxID=1002546 RepID=UPI0029C9937D|nr:hypothetical protein [uncultured Cohaesibacter sp.]